MTIALTGRGGGAWRTSRERWATLTHPTRAAEALSGALYDGADVLACEILQTRFRTLPDERARGVAVFSAVYRLRLPTGHQLLHVRAFDGSGRERFAAACAAEGSGAPIAYLPEFDAVVWTFPDDPGLPQLARLAGPGVEVLRWKPARRCVLRQRGAVARGAVAKTVHNDRMPEIVRRMRWMWDLAAADPAGFTAAEPLAWAPELKTCWQEELAGVPLMDVVLGGGDLPALMALAGRGLARLHAAAPPDGLEPVTLADRLRFAHGGPRDLAVAYPRLTTRLERLTDALERQASSLGDAEPRLVHGDFLLKQLVVVEDGRLGLFDFDDFMLGDCLEDVANCIADMHYWDLRPDVVAGMVRDFVAAYREHATWPVPEERLRWHRSVQLLRDAWYWYKRRQFEPTFHFELEAMLMRAEDPPAYY